MEETVIVPVVQETWRYTETGPAYHFSPNKDAQWSPLSPVNSPFPEFQLQGGGGTSPGILWWIYIVEL